MLRGTLAFLVLAAFAVLGSELRSVLARRGLREPAMVYVVVRVFAIRLTTRLPAIAAGPVLWERAIVAAGEDQKTGRPEGGPPS
jgi:hypothetical protein